MGKNPVVRAIAAAGTYGASELVQKKPFQDPLKDNPTGGGQGLGGLARLVSGGAAVTGTIDLGKQAQANADKQAPVEVASGPQAPTLDDAAREADAQADAERRRRGSIGRASTVLTGYESVQNVLGSNKRFLGA